jgi:hypothetical protein
MPTREIIDVSREPVRTPTHQPIADTDIASPVLSWCTGAYKDMRITIADASLLDLNL